MDKQKEKIEAQKNDVEKQVKKSYSTPQFFSYGNITEITRTNATMNMNDPGGSSTSMT